MSWHAPENSTRLSAVMKKYAECCRFFRRRTKNNPVSIGEPGVGKTAIAEGIAHRIISGDVPENLKSKRISCTRYQRDRCRRAIPRTV